MGISKVLCKILGHNYHFQRRVTILGDKGYFTGFEYKCIRCYDTCYLPWWALPPRRCFCLKERLKNYRMRRCLREEVIERDDKNCRL